MGEWGVMACVTASIVLMIALTSKFKFNIFLSMFVVSLFLGLATLPAADVVPAVKEGFGGTMKSIGVIIVLGIMIGLLLEKTSATTSLALAILRLTGRRRADLAVGLTGFVTGIPIFCDSGFVVLSGLNKSLVARTGRPPAYLATLLAVGLYSVHCLIPPHPGALAAAGIMKAGVGSLLGLGLLLAVPGALAMGAGSMVVSHANDSYFWVVTRFSGIRPDQTLKTFTTATAVVGATVFAAVLACAKVML